MTRTPQDPDAILPMVQVDEVLGTLRRKAWLVVFAVVACVGVGAWLYLTQPTEYWSRGVLRLVADRRALTEGISDDVAFDASAAGVSPLLTEVEVLASEKVLGQVVDQLGLRLTSRTRDYPVAALRDVTLTPGSRSDSIRIGFGFTGVAVESSTERVAALYGEPVSLAGVTFTVPQHPGVDWATLAIVPREVAVQDLRFRLQASPREQTNLIDVRVRAGSPGRSIALANAIVETAERVSAQSAQDASTRRRAFIEDQLRQADSTLSSLQTQLSEFRSQRAVYTGTTDQIRVGQTALTELQTRRARLDGERQTGQRLLDRLEASDAAGAREDLRSLVTAPGLSDNTAIATLHQQLVGYETERTGMTTGTFAKAPTHPDVERLTGLIGSTETALTNAVRSHLMTVGAQIAAIDELLAQSSAQLRTLPQTEAEEDRLQQQVASAALLADQLRGELQRARIAETVQVGRVEVLDQATSAIPTRSFQPIHLVLFLALGLVLGGGGAYVAEAIDTTIRRPEEVEELLSIPELAAIPPIPGLRRKRWFRRRAKSHRPTSRDHLPRLRERLDPPSLESFRILRTNLLHCAVAPGPRAIVITSPDPTEGKSTTALNVAAAFADQGLRVLLVDGDMRKPRLHRLCETSLDPGLADYLRGADHREFIRHVQPNLDLLTAGTIVGIETEGLDGPRMKRLLADGSDRYAVTIIDTPPLGVVPDAAIIGRVSNGVVLVTRAGKTKRDRARESVKQLKRVGAHVIGAVVNDPDGQLRRYGGETYYPYAYADYAAEYGSVAAEYDRPRSRR